MVGRTKVKPIQGPGMRLLQLMREYKGESSDAGLKNHISKMWEAGQTSEISAALSRRSPAAGRERAAALYELVGQRGRYMKLGEQVFRWDAAAGSESEGIEAHLAGAVVRMPKAWEKLEEGELDAVVERVKKALNEGLNGSSEWSVEFPGGMHRIVSSVFPKGIRQGVLDELTVHAKTGKWPRRGVLCPGGDVVETMIAFEKRMFEDPTERRGDFGLLLVGVVWRRASGDWGSTFEEPRWVDDLSARIESLCNEGKDEQQAEARVVCIDTLERAGDKHELLRRRDSLLQVIHEARNRMVDEDGIEMVSAWVENDEEHSFDEELRLSLWTKSGAFAYGTSWMFLMGRPKQASEDLLQMVCADLGLPHTRTATVEAKATGCDKDGRVVRYPNKEGRWLHPMNAMAGAGADLINSVNWDRVQWNLRQPGDEPGKVRPVPVALLAGGVVEVAQAHYSPKMYAALKELLGDVRLSEEAVWSELKRRFPTFDALMRHAPDAAMPGFAESVALRLHWSKAPMFVVTETLSERMQLMDIGTDIECELIPTPFKMQYFHFERPRQDLGWLDEQEGIEMDMSGFFLHEHQGDESSGFAWRVLDVAALTVDEEGKAFNYNDFRLVFESKSTTMAEALKRWEDEEEAENDWVVAVKAIWSEIIKVLVYTGSRDARKIHHNDRTGMVEALKVMSQGQRQKAQEAIRNAYDYILIGPLQALEERSEPGASGKTVSPHHRRGGIRRVACGKGREHRRLHMFPPVIVNKHLLGSDPSAWPRPKNYRVK